MAQKRMFSLSVVDTDQFLEMPLSSRLLYYELGMRADDDGFVSNWRKILAFTGLTQDDLKVLISKKYIIPFESGIIVIRHWRINNYLQKDRTKPTIYKNELKQLDLSDGVYELYTNCIHSIDKNSIDIYSPAEQDTIPYQDIINYLNLKTNKHFKNNTSKTRSLIKARIKEGFAVEDFKKVIDKKTDEWLNDSKMNCYLRPETLFGTKFESYLNEKATNKTNNIFLEIMRDEYGNRESD